MSEPRAPRPTRPAPARHWARRLVGAALLTVAGLWPGAGIASAHAVLFSTDPARDTVLTALPARASLTFGESVALPPRAVRVFDPDGVEVDDGHPDHPEGDATVGVGVRPGTKQGSYTVAWRVISADTHPVSGAFVFSVGHPSATSATTEAPPGGSALVGTLYAIVRALAYGSYAAMVGAAALLLCCWPAGVSRAIGPRVAVTGWMTLLLATVATLLLQGPYGNGTGLGDVFEPGAIATTLRLPLGGALAARLLLLGGVAIYLGQLTRRLTTATPRSRRLLATTGLALAVGTALTWSVSGHAAVGLQPWIALPADVAHLLAMAIWLGGLTVLAIALRRPPREPEQARELAAAVSRFSPIAFGCVTVLVVTGTYQSWRQMGSWNAFLDTDYGRVLGLKILAVATMVAVAAASRRAVSRMRRQVDPALAAVLAPSVPQPVVAAPARTTTTVEGSGPGPALDPLLGRTVLVEAAVAVAVLSLTAILVDAEPGRTAEAAEAATAHGPTHARLTFDTGGPDGAGTIEVRLDPTRTGPNSLDVTVRNPNGADRDIPELDAELTLPDRHLGPLAVPVERLGPGHYHGTEQIPLPGAWQLALTVRTSDIDETTVRLPAAIR